MIAKLSNLNIVSEIEYDSDFINDDSDNTSDYSDLSKSPEKKKKKKKKK